jgi:imidazolonepropionase-like amidohydrolase
MGAIVRGRSLAFSAVAVLMLMSSNVFAETVYVRAGRVIDVEAGRVLPDQIIRLEGGRIVAIAAAALSASVSAGNVPPANVPQAGTPSADASSANARIVDWSRYTVLPGLIDLHTHIVGDIQSNNIAGPLLSSGARDALVGAGNARTTLEAGFTAIRDVGVNRAFTDVALRNAIDAGLVDGPRMYVAGAYITVSMGGGDIVGLAPDVVLPPDFRRGVANSADEVRREPCSRRAPRRRHPNSRKLKSVPLSKKRRMPAHSSRLTRTGQRGSSAPCARAFARSSTARTSMTKASR